MMAKVPGVKSKRDSRDLPEKTIARWEALARWAELVGSDLQPWPAYFGFRAREMSAVLEVGDSHRDILEIGCGIGFTSALLGTTGRRVIALDLPRKNEKFHSIGLERAQEFKRRLELDNPPVLVAGDGCRLPLPDASVDLVVSVYALEHIPRRAQVCQEIHRVLRPGGEAIILVPGAAERLWAPAWYYLHTVREVATSAWNYFFPRRVRRGRKTQKDADGGAPTGAAVSRRSITHLLERFRYHYPHFPAVPPHGVYRDWWDEFRSCRSSAWRRLFEGSGLRVVDQRASMLVPVALLDEFGPEFRDTIARLLHKTTARWGRTRVGRALAHGSAWRLERAIEPAVARAPSDESLFMEPVA